MGVTLIMMKLIILSIYIQVQAIVVATLAATAAVTMAWVVDGHFNINHATLLCASSLVTATVASLILGSLMVGIIFLSRQFKINPDNIATPIAASLGDLVTLALLSGISSFLHRCLGILEIHLLYFYNSIKFLFWDSTLHVFNKLCMADIAIHNIHGFAIIRTLFLGSNHWIAPLISGGFYLLLPCFIYICHHNKYTQNILYNGWNPVISAMVISR